MDDFNSGQGFATEQYPDSLKIVNDIKKEPTINNQTDDTYSSVFSEDLGKQSKVYSSEQETFQDAKQDIQQELPHETIYKTSCTAGSIQYDTSVSSKKWSTTLILSSVLGWAGAHRFYTGKYVSGLLQLCTFGGFGIWSLIDFLKIAKGEFTDENGRQLSGMGTGRGKFGMTANMRAATAYSFGIISALIIYANEKENEEVKFHAAQALTLGFAYIIFKSVFSLLSTVTGIDGIGSALTIGYFVLQAIMMKKGADLERFRIPLIADFAEDKVLKSNK